MLGLVEWYVPQGGLFLWIKVKGLDNMLDLVMNKCVPQGIMVLPGNAFNYDAAKHDCHLRFSYSYASLEEIDKVSLKINFYYLSNITTYVCMYTSQKSTI